MIVYEDNNKLRCLILEADDVNDPDWQKIIYILRKNKIKVLYGNDNFMCFQWEKE